MDETAMGWVGGRVLAGEGVGDAQVSRRRDALSEASRCYRYPTLTYLSNIYFGNVQKNYTMTRTPLSSLNTVKTLTNIVIFYLIGDH